jgi:hypothetical protein
MGQRQHKVTPTRVVARWAIGKHWDGHPRSEARFWRRGSTGTRDRWFGRREASAWALLPGWARALTWWLTLAVAVGLVKWRAGTEWCLVLAGGPAAGLALVRALRRTVTRSHMRRLVGPTALVLAPQLGVAPRVAQESLSIVRDYEDTAGGERVGSLALPDDFAGLPEQRAVIQRVIADRTGLELRWQWALNRHPLALNFTRAPVPPALVPLADVLAELAAAPEHLIMLGRDAEGTMQTWDRSAEDPHVAVHGGSRRGKTSLLLLLAVQDLLRGGSVTAIDPKRVSLMALAGLPGVTLVNDPRDVPGMWAAVAAFRAMIEDRFEQLAADPTIEFPRALLLLDEVSMLSGMSAQVWRRMKDPSDPALAPIWEDLGPCVWLGAQVRAHVVVAGQRLDYKILGNLLGSFGLRLLAGYQKTDYDRLVGLSPYLRSQKPRGRFLFYDGGDPAWLQLIYADPDDWRAYAVEQIQAARELSQPGPERGPEQAREHPAGTGDSAVLIVGLAAAAAHLGMGEAAFRKARQRRAIAGETSAGGRPAWTGEALTAWR